jgi:hypothetical protein
VKKGYPLPVLIQLIRNAEPEMKDCVSEMKSCFLEINVVDVDTRAAWYICKPSN